MGVYNPLLWPPTIRLMEVVNQWFPVRHSWANHVIEFVQMLHRGHDHCITNSVTGCWKRETHLKAFYTCSSFGESNCYAVNYTKVVYPPELHVCWQVHVWLHIHVLWLVCHSIHSCISQPGGLQSGADLEKSVTGFWLRARSVWPLLALVV